MRIRPYTLLALTLLFILAAGLMIGAMRRESATVDETVFLGAGHSYWMGYRYRLNPEHPPLMQLLAAFPLQMLHAQDSPICEAILSGRMLAETTPRWDLSEENIPLSTAEMFPHGPDFYHYAFNEEPVYGGNFIYGGQNNAEKLLFWGRIPEVLLTLVAGLVVFLWARSVRGEVAGLLAASMFLLNPVVLAYGHIVQTDIGMALAFSLAAWTFARLLERPDWRRVVSAGLSLGLALAVKYTSVILVPTLLGLWGIYRWRHRGASRVGGKMLLAVAAIAWTLILILYAPHWLPAPPIDATAAARLGVPHWFVWLRPLLIPAEYFKGLAIVLLHTSSGQPGYLNGVWSREGWWYYFPLALLMKTPLPFLLFAVAGGVGAVRFRRELGFMELTAWASAALFLLSAMCSKADLGVRHVLAVYPLISVGAACGLVGWMEHIAVTKRQLMAGAMGALCLTALLVAALAYPFFISYMSPLVGGTEHGQEHLLDSNFDWGQDVIRLKEFLGERGIHNFYLQYFGTQAAIEYYKLPCEFVTDETAKRVQQGYVVVSAQALMLPGWQWLRESYRPVARVGYTLFVYRMGNQ